VTLPAWTWALLTFVESFFIQLRAKKRREAGRREDKV
jgi:hypothetical protein